LSKYEYEHGAHLSFGCLDVNVRQGDENSAPGYERLVQQQVEDIDRQSFGKQHCDE